MLRSARRRLDLVRGLSLAVISAAGLALFAPAASAEMTFQAVRLGDRVDVIAATGQITESTPDQFAAFLDANPELLARRPTVFLDSPGGRVVASMEFGKLMRRVGATAVVARVGIDGNGDTVVTNADCLSACVYALMGASRRVIPSSSVVGIHRMFAYEAEVDPSGTTAVIHKQYDNGEMGDFLKRYSSEMGVSPGLISAAEHIPSNRLKILSRSDIRRWHLGVSQ